MPKQIKIHPNPNFIIVAVFPEGYFHFWLKDLNTKNKYSDIGCWIIKYK